MAITYPLALPVKDVERVTFRARSVVAVSTSPFTGEQQVQAHQGQWWEAEIKLPVMSRADADAWNAFRLKLNGREGTFLLGDPEASIPRGAAKTTPGTPLVKGASQTGNEIDIDGAPADVTGYLLAGDYIQLGSGATARLYKVLDDADSDASGNVTLTIWPKLRSSPADNDSVVVSGAKGRFCMASNETAWDELGAIKYGIAFAAIEAL